MKTSRTFLPGPLSFGGNGNGLVPLRVDDFTPNACVYFLTHAHEDHLYKLTEKWRCGRVYCTEITAKLVRLRYPALPRHLFEIVHIGERRMVEIGEHSLCVQVLDANHCPGSCMFLLESSSLFGKCSVLHTGDFRFERERDIPSTLRQGNSSSSSSSTAMCVYLDNTFGLLNSPSFPPRRIVADALLRALCLYDLPNTCFVFDIKSMGKEELLLEAAERLDTLVCLDDARMAKMEIFYPKHAMRRFTTDVHGKARIFCSPARPPEQTEYSRIVTVKPTGWCGNAAFEDLLALERKEVLPDELRVPYSLHSTRREIDQFLRACAARVRWVVPTVNCTIADRNEIFPNRLGEEEAPLPLPVYIPSPPPAHSSTSHAASPESHQRRLELKRTRFLGEEEQVQVLFRRLGQKSNSNRMEAAAAWTAEEDLALEEMWQLRVRGECALHLQTRTSALAQRTDMEIITRTLVRFS